MVEPIQQRQGAINKSKNTEAFTPNLQARDQMVKTSESLTRGEANLEKKEGEKSKKEPDSSSHVTGS